MQVLQHVAVKLYWGTLALSIKFFCCHMQNYTEAAFLNLDGSDEVIEICKNVDG